MSTDAMLEDVAQYLTTNWVPTFHWEEAKLPARPPVSTFWVERMMPSVTDQGETLGIWAAVEITMRLYISTVTREKAAQLQMRDELDNLITVLANDATLGRSCLRFTIDPDGVTPLFDEEEKLIVVNIPATVEPFTS